MSLPIKNIAPPTGSSVIDYTSDLHGYSLLCNVPAGQTWFIRLPRGRYLPKDVTPAASKVDPAGDLAWEPFPGDPARGIPADTISGIALPFFIKADTEQRLKFDHESLTNWEIEGQQAGIVDTAFYNIGVASQVTPGIVFAPLIPAITFQIPEDLTSVYSRLRFFVSLFVGGQLGDFVEFAVWDGTQYLYPTGTHADGYAKIKDPDDVVSVLLMFQQPGGVPTQNANSTPKVFEVHGRVRNAAGGAGSGIGWVGRSASGLPTAPGGGPTIIPPRVLVDEFSLA